MLTVNIFIKKTSVLYISSLYNIQSYREQFSAHAEFYLYSIKILFTAHSPWCVVVAWNICLT